MGKRLAGQQEWRPDVHKQELRELIEKMTGKKSKLSTLQPEKDINSKKQNKRHKPPYHFLISDVTKKAMDVMSAYPIISTPKVSAFFLAYTSPTPRFLCIIEGFILSICTPVAITELEGSEALIIQKTLVKSETMVTLLKSKLIDNDALQHNLDPAASILCALKVYLVKNEDTIDHSATARLRKPL